MMMSGPSLGRSQKNLQSNILHLRFKIYSLKVQKNHTYFPIIASVSKRCYSGVEA